jgi:hypothetical protein
MNVVEENTMFEPTLRLASFRLVKSRRRIRIRRYKRVASIE